jgi:hypothetical protein
MRVSVGRTKTGKPKVYADMHLAAKRVNGVVYSTWSGRGHLRCGEDEAQDLVVAALAASGYPVDLAEGVLATAKHGRGKDSTGTFSSPYVSPRNTPEHSEE